MVQNPKGKRWWKWKFGSVAMQKTQVVQLEAKGMRQQEGYKEIQKASISWKHWENQKSTYVSFGSNMKLHFKVEYEICGLEEWNQFQAMIM